MAHIEPPSRRFFGIFLLVITLIILWVILGKFRANTTDEVVAEESQEDLDKISGDGFLTVIEKDSGELFIDTDEDGLQDWEEVFWGLSPLDYDSNDDGLSDYDTVQLLKEQDKNSMSLKNQQILASLPDENLTKTDLYARDLYAAVAVRNPRDSSQDLINQGAADIKAILAPRIYTTSDVIIVDRTDQSFEDYLAGMSLLFEDGTRIETKHIEKLGNDLENYEPRKEMLGVAQLVFLIEQAIDIMSSLSVPNDLATLHLNMLNAYSGALSSLQALRHIESDPLVAASGLSQFGDFMSELSVHSSTLLKQYELYYSKNN